MVAIVYQGSNSPLCIDASPRNQGNGTLNHSKGPRLRGSREYVLSARDARRNPPSQVCCQIHCRGALGVSFRHLASYFLAAHTFMSCVSLCTYTVVGRATGKNTRGQYCRHDKASAQTDRMTRLRVPNTPHTNPPHPCLQEFPEASKAAQTIPTNQLC